MRISKFSLFQKLLLCFLIVLFPTYVALKEDKLKSPFVYQWRNNYRISNTLCIDVTLDTDWKTLSENYLSHKKVQDYELRETSNAEISLSTQT
jgi:hypothetical protein